ncbi:hypothetical protein pqer_cds_946 [Pandoravirus quercus]|uniref:Uncharacterized protein n=1 Tax=Pandoravirus quercus TaxID=2107709 RepID=A0A2U7UA88_9VIRU|nr:hypothetical protein pqer_cds_946 [Pandoravirus quercus]AVK75368.1 hypothetical protein pqer_cds_946 [Pandoravirus quercus]
MKGSSCNGVGVPNPEVGIACLPPELIGMILGYVGDCDFCRCCQASALFWVPPTDAAIETRKRRWRGCREPHDFCATGNVEALVLLWDRAVAFDVHMCVVNAIAHKYGNCVLGLLRRIGLVTSSDSNSICDEWRQEACYEASRNGRIDVLAAAWHPRLGPDCITDGAIRGDSLAAFQWACEARGIPPQRDDVYDILKSGAMTILAHCRRMHIDHVSWASMAEAAAHESLGLETVLLCMDDDTPSRSRYRIGYLLCGSAPLCDIETFYRRFPDAIGIGCLFEAADARRVDVAHWLCERFPTLADRLADDLVGAPPSNGMFAVHRDDMALVKWLYDDDLVGDVPQLARIAAERGQTQLMAHIIDRELPFADLPSACGY